MNPKDKLKSLQEEAQASTKAAKEIAEKAEAASRQMTAAERKDFDSHIAKGRELLEQMKPLKHDVEILDQIRDLAIAVNGKDAVMGRPSGSGARDWAEQVAAKMTKTATELGVKAITAGSIDVPAPISTGIVNLPDTLNSVVDLLLDREGLDGNEFIYLRQTVKTNNAAPVADSATKPTSVYTWTDITDRARVFAHLSEPIPNRYLDDHATLIQVLNNEMFQGVFDVIDEQILTGDGTGENVTGILETSGIVTQAFATDVFTTLRKARTGFFARNEVPTAWVFNPTDFEAFDLAQDAEDRYYGNTVDANIFGSLPKIISTGIPAGTALLGDFEQARLFVREDVKLDSDSSGDLFKKNQFMLRAEGRFGFGVLRPQAFTTVDLTA